jgi:hypothetical protein
MQDTQRHILEEGDGISSNPFSDASFQNRRMLRDRRAHPTSFISIFRFKGRRRSFRRTEEGRNHYVDCLSSRTLLLALVLTIYSILDAFFTLLHLEHGAQEANPLMNTVLLSGVTPFLLIKSLGVGFGGVLLAIHQNFRIFWFGLHGLAVVYTMVLAYHMVLFII